MKRPKVANVNEKKKEKEKEEETTMIVEDIMMIEIDIEKSIKVIEIVIKIDKEKRDQKKLIFVIIVENMDIGLMNVLLLKKKSKKKIFFI